ncbi:MAG TPA: GYF domain-containing protein [Chitinophagaceae bacterium]|jgi:hypothetical protein|nr:DUF4339 domain-containing protein [Chitinophagaceae bacterium]HPH23782.1 GYF domain-containing protein [Chitinophagaceae bacterium]
MEKIYILKKKKLMYGPYSLNYVKEKGIKKDDMVWYEGLNDWTQAENIEFLIPFISTDANSALKKKNLIQKVFSFLQ